MSRIHVIGGLEAALRFLTPAWRGAWAVLTLASVLFGVCLATRPGYPHLGCIALALLAAVAAQGALYRLALGRELPGPAGLQWGPVEWRLLAAAVLIAAFLFVLSLLVFVVVLCLAYAVASAGKGFVASDVATWAPAVDGRGGAVASGVAVIGALGLAWAAARVSLAGAASVAKEQVQVLSTWPLTRGVGWRIVLARALIAAPPTAIVVALTPVFTFAGAHRGAGATWALDLVAGLAIAGLWLPLSVGLMAYLYGRLSPVST